MTDIPSVEIAVPTRLGVTARVDDGVIGLELAPQPETLHHGIVRASVLSFVIDAAAGIQVDDDPDVWTLTSDMSVRMRPIPAPARITARNTILRRGRRSAVCKVDLTTDDGAPVATGGIGFVAITRKETEPAKPVVSPERAAEIFSGASSLTRPLRDEAGIEVLDAAQGVAQLEVTPQLRNPAGTLQGAMVALLAEAAAEDMISTRFESPVVVTDLDLRYLAPAQVGPVRTRSQLLGTTASAPVEIELVDTTTDRVTTLVYARAERVA
jgi:acyl-coenzyme A thioesterase PaaI-like protein